MFENYQDVINQLNDFGLQVTDLKVDTNRPERVGVDTNLCTVDNAKKKTAGWYHLASFVANGKNYIVGAFGFWSGTNNNLQKVEWDKTVEITPEQRKAQAARMRAMQKAAAESRAQEVETAARRAQWIWSKYTPQGESDYLKRKGVKAHGLRFGPHGTVAIPMMDGRGKLYGLQLIRSDAAIKGTKKIQKKFEPKGLGMRGHYHLIGSPREVCLVAEGYATAATIYEQTGLPVAVAFNANNLKPVAENLKKSYPETMIVICADDDYLQKCKHCKTPTIVENPTCSHCGQPHNQTNPGITAAEDAINAIGGRIAIPHFKDQDGNDYRNGEKLTDFNDLALHPQGGPHLVRSQIESACQGLSISTASATAAVPLKGEGESSRPDAISIMPIEDIVERFMYVDDDAGDTCFDRWTRQPVRLKKAQGLLPAKARWDEVKSHPVWMKNAVYVDQIGFDPTEKDPDVKCNMWNGWPMQPKQGECTKLLTLLEYLCCGEENHKEIYDWVLKWLAYPLQNPGAKMQSAVVIHGPQGTGKSLFFEMLGRIYGEYGIVLSQGAIEDKFNSDWTSKKLYVVADEVVANAEKHHLKNQLKGLITGEWIRVNPKNVAAHKEKNQMNLVFLSNEKQPVVLENDDRRHCVIWTPPKLDPSAYKNVAEEVDNGGVEALYHYLLNLDLTGFDKHTKPPMTKSKRQLIDINRDTVDGFIEDWLTDGLDYPVGPVMSSDLYSAYCAWCHQNGEKFPRSSKVFNAHIDKLPGWFRGHKDRYDNMHYQGPKKRVRVIIPSDADVLRAEQNGITVFKSTPSQTLAQYITDSTVSFETARAQK